MALVETEDRGAVRHLILNRPEKRNAMHGELVLAIGAALKEASIAPHVHCVVLRGAGAMFSSGMDFAALGGLARRAGQPAAVPSRDPRRLERRRGDDEADDLPDPRRLHRRRDGAGARVRPAHDGDRRGDRDAGDARRADTRRRRLLAAAGRRRVLDARRS